MPKSDTKPTDAEDFWRTRGDAAKELSVLLGSSVTTNTIAGWLRRGAPVPAGGGAIERQPLIEWALTNAHSQISGDKDDSLRNRYLQEQVRNLELKNGRLAEASIDAAEVRTGILRAVEELKRALLEEVPPKAWGLSQGRSVDESVPDIAGLIGGILNRFQKAATP